MTLSLPVLVYDCDQCGACCRHSILECDPIDVLREPRIQAEGRLKDGGGTIPLDMAGWNINGPRVGNENPCVFLGGDNRCGIYPTRPGMCVDFQAGSQQCQDRRASAGIAILHPRRVEEPTICDRLHALARGTQE